MLLACGIDKITAARVGAPRGDGTDHRVLLPLELHERGVHFVPPLPLEQSQNINNSEKRTLQCHSGRVPVVYVTSYARIKRKTTRIYRSPDLCAAKAMPEDVRRNSI